MEVYLFVLYPWDIYLLQSVSCFYDWTNLYYINQISQYVSGSNTVLLHHSVTLTKYLRNGISWLFPCPYSLLHCQLLQAKHQACSLTNLKYESTLKLRDGSWRYVFLELHKNSPVLLPAFLFSRYYCQQMILQLGNTHTRRK